MGSVQGGLGVDVNGYNLRGSVVYIDGKLIYKIKIIYLIYLKLIGIDCSMPSTATVMKCKSPKEPSDILKKDFIGNRGLFAIEQSGGTEIKDLSTSSPNNSNKKWLGSAYFSSSINGASTVWIEGYVAPMKSAYYLFELSTNGQGILLLSSDNTTDNKVI